MNPALPIAASQYNGFNQLLTVTESGGGQTTFGYDGNGNQVSKAVRTGFVTQRSTYGYDGDNRLRAVTVPSGSPGTATDQWASSATASASWSPTGSWSPSQATGAPDVEGCISSGKAWASPGTATTTQWLRLEYATPTKAVGVRVHETGGDGAGVTRVEAIDEGGTSHELWSGTDGTSCGGWFEAVIEETTYRVVALRVTTVGTRHIDAVSLVSAPAAGPELTSTYEYDANGLRTRKADSTGTRSYLLDGLSVVAECAPDASRLAWYTQSLARIDEVLSTVNGQGKYWYQADALGSTYAMTDSAGAMVSRSGYDVFGERSLDAGMEVGQPFGFTGREHDASGLVYARARYLSSVHGRWLTEDPVNLRSMATPTPAEALLGGDPYTLSHHLVTDPLLANRYASARGSPTGFADPLGQIPILTVLHGLGYAATIMAVVSFFSMVGVAGLAAAMYMAGEYGVANDLGEMMVGFAVATVGFLVVGTLLAPELMALLAYQEYWWAGVTLLFLGCVGYAGGKIYSSAGSRGWSTLGFCAMRFWRAWVTRNPIEFLKRPDEC